MSATQLRVMSHLSTPLVVPDDVVDLNSFRRWALSDEFPPGVRASFLDGEMELEMSPQDVNSHGSPKLALTVAVGQYFDELDCGEVYVDGTLLSSEDANISNEPDLSAALWSTLESGRLRATVDERDSERQVELVGAPDLAVEIVSRSSVRKDTKVLRERYWIAGIPEYWLIDCRKKEINFQLLTATPTGFVAAVAKKDGWLWSPVLTAHILLTRSRNRAGRWRYRLQIEPKDSDQ